MVSAHSWTPKYCVVDVSTNRRPDIGNVLICRLVPQLIAQFGRPDYLNQLMKLFTSRLRICLRFRLSQAGWSDVTNVLGAEKCRSAIQKKLATVNWRQRNLITMRLHAEELRGRDVTINKCVSFICPPISDLKPDEVLMAAVRDAIAKARARRR